MIYRLGTIEVDSAKFLLTADGETVSVEPLVFDLIVYLLENRDRVLTRQELLDNIWPGKIVSDTSLSNHIKSARKALGDDGHEQRVIRTVHGRGYRLVADVDEIAKRQSTREDARTTGRRVGAPRRKRLAVYAAIILLIVPVASFFLMSGREAPVESIAVLPLKNLSNDPEQQYFAEGIQDALITRLSRVTDLRVISKTSTMRYEATDKSVPEIARELKVDALVEGSVMRDDGRVRITAQLVRGSVDEHLWAASYDRDMDHVLPLISEISMAIADEIEVAVEPARQQDSPQVAAVDARVLELVLKGRHYAIRFMIDEALRHYQAAAELDPEFAYAHAGLAGSYFLKEFFNQAPDTDLIPLARAAALRALALDGNSPEGHTTLGSIQLYFDWDWESAQRNLRRALELDPGDAFTRHAYADYLMVMGDLEESLNQTEIALLYDPHSEMTRVVVEYHRLLLRQYDTVIENCLQALEEWPESRFIYSRYQEALWLKGLQEEGLAAYKKSWGRDEELLQAMEDGYSKSGYEGAVLALADTLARRVPAYNDYIALAALYARAGEPDLAVSWLDQAYEHRQPQILHVQALPVFAELHADPKFEDLLRRIGFPRPTRSSR